MQSSFVRQSACLLALAIMITSFCLFDVAAQTRKRRRSRRIPKPVITNPKITTPAPSSVSASGEDKIISTADENSATEQTAENGGTASSSLRRTSTQRKPGSDQEQMQQTITTLSEQVTKLTDKLSQMQDEQRSLLDMERLTRSEQRAETLRAQLRDVQAKQGDLQAKIEQIEYALKPESIDRAVSLYGTTHPEEARDSRRRQLENERSRTQDQLNQLDTSRVRLEQAITTADAEVELLRQRLEKGNPAAGQTQSPTATDSALPASEAPPPKNPIQPR